MKRSYNVIISVFMPIIRKIAYYNIILYYSKPILSKTWVMCPTNKI